MAFLKKRIILINKRFQFRVASYTGAWVLGISVIYLLVVFGIFEYFIKNSLLEPLGAEISVIRGVRSEAMMLLVATQVLFLVLAILVTLLLGHRIAGPMYRMKMVFRKITETGNLCESLHFRRKDHFKDLAAQYNEMMQSVCDRIDVVSTQIERAASHTDAEGRKELEAAIRSLQAMTTESMEEKS